MVLAIARVCGLFYAGTTEPHRVGTGQALSVHRAVDLRRANEGRRREVWISVASGQLEVDVKKRMHRDVTTWALEGKADSTPSSRRSVLYPPRGDPG